MNMEEKKKEYLSTQKLMQLLEASPDIHEAPEGQQESIGNPTASDYLKQLLQDRGGSIPQVVQKSGLSKSFVCQIFDGTRIPGRDILLRICFALELDLDETQRLLTLARKGPLYPKVRRDAAMIFCLQRQLTLEETAELLESIGEASLL